MSTPKFNCPLVVGIASGYGLDDRGVGVRVPVGSRILFSKFSKTGSGAHPASYPKGTGALSHGVKWPGREADHSPPTTAEVKKTRVYTSTPPYTFMVKVKKVKLSVCLTN
jgi:hypothetical protein